jgi:hypothetical protein
MTSPRAARIKAIVAGAPLVAVVALLSFSYTGRTCDGHACAGSPQLVGTVGGCLGAVSYMVKRFVLWSTRRKMGLVEPMTARLVAFVVVDSIASALVGTGAFLVTHSTPSAAQGLPAGLVAYVLLLFGSPFLWAFLQGTTPRPAEAIERAFALPQRKPLPNIWYGNTRRFGQVGFPTILTTLAGLRIWVPDTLEEWSAAEVSAAVTQLAVAVDQGLPSKIALVRVGQEALALGASLMVSRPGQSVSASSAFWVYLVYLYAWMLTTTLVTKKIYPRFERRLDTETVIRTGDAPALQSMLRRAGGAGGLSSAAALDRRIDLVGRLATADRRSIQLATAEVDQPSATDGST